MPVEKQNTEETEKLSSGSAESGYVASPAGGTPSVFVRGRERKNKLDPLFREPMHLPGNDTGEALSVGSVDMTFLLIVIALVLYGATMAYSASSIHAFLEEKDSLVYIKKHLFFIFVGTVCTFPFVLRCRPWHWKLFSILAYGGTVFLLFLVLVIGISDGEAKRWLALGKITVQPSEIAKLAVVMVLALVMGSHERQITSETRFGGSFRYGVLYPGIALGVLVVLVAAENHISGALIIALIGAAVMFMGGTRLRYLLILGGIVMALAVALVLFSSYADTRIEIWLHIDEMDPLGDAWQTLQGLYAIGSGGLFGLGLGNSRQKFGYVSEPDNDFIFTIVCEELGFFGAAMVVLLFGLLVWRGFQIAAAAPDRFSALMVYGIVFKTALQAVLNIAVVTNSMPNTGISLPFFSSGGSAMIIQLFEMGIVLNISRYSRVHKV